MRHRIKRKPKLVSSTSMARRKGMMDDVIELTILSKSDKAKMALVAMLGNKQIKP